MGMHQTVLFRKDDPAAGRAVWIKTNKTYYYRDENGDTVGIKGTEVLSLANNSYSFANVCVTERGAYYRVPAKPLRVITLDLIGARVSTNFQCELPIEVVKSSDMSGDICLGMYRLPFRVTGSPSGASTWHIGDCMLVQNVPEGKRCTGLLFWDVEIDKGVLNCEMAFNLYNKDGTAAERETYKMRYNSENGYFTLKQGSAVYRCRCSSCV